MGRSRLAERASIHVYLTEEQKRWLEQAAHRQRLNPSKLIRGWVELMMSAERLRKQVTL